MYVKNKIISELQKLIYSPSSKLIQQQIIIWNKPNMKQYHHLHGVSVFKEFVWASHNLFYKYIIFT